MRRGGRGASHSASGTKERRRVFTVQFTVAVEKNRKEEKGEEEEGEHPHCATTEAESSLVRCWITLEEEEGSQTRNSGGHL